MRRTTISVLLLAGLGAARLFKDEAYLPHAREMSTIGGAGLTPISTPTAVSNLEILELRQAPGLVPAGAAPPVDPGLAPQPDPGNRAVPAPAAAPAPAAPPSNPAPAPMSPEVLAIPPFDAPNAPANAPDAPAAPPPNAPAAPAINPPAAASTSARPVAPLAANPDTSVPHITTTSSLLSTPGVNQDFVSVQWVETWIGGTSQTWVPKTITFHFQAFVTQAPMPGIGEIGMGTLTGVPGQTKTVAAAAAPTQDTALLKGLVAALGVGVAGIFV